MTTLAPSGARARLARGTLDELGLADVPVGKGTDGGQQGDVESMLGLPYMGAVQTVSGQELMTRVLGGEPDGSVTLLVVASIRDAAYFLRDHEPLFLRKVREVVIMGGVVDTPDGAAAHAPLKPDSSHNNEFDPSAARFFYRRCQELGVRLLVLSRFVAYACSVPRGIYDEMAASGSPIGVHLQAVQAASIEKLWRRACSPPGSALRASLPTRCDKAWFCNTFCDGEGLELSPRSSVWSLVRSFNMYDPLALLLAVPRLRHLFDLEAREVRIKGSGGRSVTHYLAGTSKSASGVADPEVMRDFLIDGLMDGIRSGLLARRPSGDEGPSLPAKSASFTAPSRSRRESDGPRKRRASIAAGRPMRNDEVEEDEPASESTSAMPRLSDLPRRRPERSPAAARSK